MALLIQAIEIENDFWEVNPGAKYVFHYVKKTKDTSRMMWAYTLFYHPKSEYFEMDKQSRLENCQRFYKEDWVPEANEKLDKDFQLHCLTKSQRNVTTWGNKLDERTSYIDTTPYNASTIDILEKLLANNKKIYDTYREALAEMEKEEEQTTFGGILESAGELGLFD